MSELAVALALGSAFLHALWNVLIARESNSEAALGVALPIGVLAFAPVAILYWDVRAEVIPYLVASWAVALLFYGLLAAAYRRSDLSLVYPISRGMAPVFVLIAAMALLALEADGRQATGVLTVGVGVVLIRGLRGGYDGRGTLLGLSIAACIAAYTLIDRAALQYAHPLAYVWLAYLAPAFAYLGFAARSHGRDALRQAIRPGTVTAAISMFAAYSCALAALTMAPPASVAAIRESSVVIATVMAAVFLRERVTPVRLTGAVVVVAGVAVLAG